MGSGKTLKLNNHDLGGQEVKLDNSALAPDSLHLLIVFLFIWGPLVVSVLGLVLLCKFQGSPAKLNNLQRFGEPLPWAITYSYLNLLSLGPILGILIVNGLITGGYLDPRALSAGLMRWLSPMFAASLGIVMFVFWFIVALGI